MEEEEEEKRVFLERAMAPNEFGEAFRFRIMPSYDDLLVDELDAREAAHSNLLRPYMMR